MGPAVAAAAGMGDGLVTSAFNMMAAEQSRDYNREMASTAHQREVKDLRLAGLNPVLSAGGHGASVAPSPTPQAHNFDMTNKAIQVHQMRNQDRLIDAQVRDINSAAALKEIEGRVKLRTEPESIDHVREALVKLRRDSDISDLDYQRIQKAMELMDIEKGIKTNEKTHSAYDLDKAKSESEFYQGPGGDVEHWLKMLGIQVPGLGALRFLKGKGGSPRLKNNSRRYREFESTFKGKRDLDRSYDSGLQDNEGRW